MARDNMVGSESLIDVCIIGAGLAGAAAAAAVIESGASVKVFNRGMGETAFVSAMPTLVDGVRGDENVLAALQWIAQHYPEHRYAKIGSQQVMQNYRQACASLNLGELFSDESQHDAPETAEWPPAAGLRLQRHIHTWLEHKEVLIDVWIEGLQEVPEGWLVQAGASAIAFRARALVLATGGLIGGGFEVADGPKASARETLLGLLLYVRDLPLVEQDPQSLIASEFQAEHSIQRARVRVAPNGRALDAPAGVFAAGALLGAQQVSPYLVGTGLALVSGTIAGQNAALFAQNSPRG